MLDASSKKRAGQALGLGVLRGGMAKIPGYLVG